MTPAAVKKLVEKRNERFVQAVNEYEPLHVFSIQKLTSMYSLLEATQPPEDPVQLLQEAGRDHIPVHPGVSSEQAPVRDLHIPDAASRPSIDELLTEIEKEEWCKSQMVANKVFEPRKSRTGRLPLCRILMREINNATLQLRLKTHYQTPSIMRFLLHEGYPPSIYIKPPRLTLWTPAAMSSSRRVQPQGRV